MAGLYIHVPFCVKRCSYCDFYSNTDMSLKDAYIKVLITEMDLSRDYLNKEEIQTIYFGGGTPSQLSSADFEQLFSAIDQYYNINYCEEITLEANPDDLSEEYLKSILTLPFNRISIGIQSFHEEDLKLLNRRHTGTQATNAIYKCKDSGLTNISIDLMYGLPGQTLSQWEDNIDKALALDVPHISAYHLTYEEGTSLHTMLKKKQISAIDEEQSISMYTLLIDKLKAAGYHHYEISNFARPDFISLHNSSYWTGVLYLGLGASAHSYNRIERKWNVSSIREYIKCIQSNIPAYEKEVLTQETRYNDYIVTRLRTVWGINLKEIESLFGSVYVQYVQQHIDLYVKKGLIIEENEAFRLSKDGFFISDSIICDFLWI